MHGLQGNETAAGSASPLTTARRARWSLIVLAGAACLVLVVCFVDQPILRWTRGEAFAQAIGRPARQSASILRAPGHAAFTAAVAVALAIWHRKRLRAAITLAAAAAGSGIGVWLIKWIVGRPRPDRSAGLLFEIHPFDRGLDGLLRQSGVCFPSGDAALAFATAGVLAGLLPRHRIAFYLVACVVGAQRIAAGAHYVSDVLAGAGLGLLCAAVAQRMWTWKQQP